MRNVQLVLSLAASVLVTLLAGSRRYIHHRHRCGNHQRIVISVFRVSALIATLATGSILGGAAFAYSGGAPARAPTGIANFAVQTRLGVSNSCWTALVIVVIVAVLCAKRVWGRQLAAVGTNEAAARQSGMRVKALIVSAYISSALCASIAGIVLAGSVRTPKQLPRRLLSAALDRCSGYRGNKPGRRSRTRNRHGHRRAVPQPTQRIGIGDGRSVGHPIYIQALILAAAIGAQSIRYPTWPQVRGGRAPQRAPTLTERSAIRTA